MIQRSSSFDNPLPAGWIGGNGPSYTPFGLIEGSESYSHAIVTDIKRASNSAWRMEIRPGDDPVFWGSRRAEISITTKGNANTYKQTALRFSTYIPSGVWAASSQEEIFPFQQHPWSSSNNGGSPSLAIEIRNDIWQVAVRHTQTGSETKLTTVKNKVERDVWVDWVVYYLPHVTSGRIIIWRRVNGVDADYKEWFSHTGPCLHSWSQFPFLKMGIYKWNNPSTGATNFVRRGYIDEVAFGQSTPTGIVAEFGIPALSAPPPPPNTPPRANAGPDQVLAAGTVVGALNGAGTDAEGGVLTPLWAQVSGPNTAALVPGQWDTAIGGLVPGDYIFRLTVKDSAGAVGTDEVKVTVEQPAPPPPPPPDPKLVFEFTDVNNSKSVRCLDDGSWGIVDV